MRSSVSVFVALFLVAPCAAAQSGTPFYDLPSEPAPASAPAPAPPSASAVAAAGSWVRFGARGSLVFSAASNLDGFLTEYADPSKASSWGITISPGADWFVVRGLSVGIDVDYDTGNSKGYLITTGSFTEYPYTDVGGGARVGYAIPLGEAWSLWPQVGAYYDRSTSSTRYDDGSVPEVKRAAHGFTFVGYIPLVFQPASNVFVGFGPRVTVPAVTQEESAHVLEVSRIGATFLVGGFVGGEEETSEAAPRTADVRPRRFGDEGVLVVGADFIAGGSHSEDSSYPYSSNAFLLQPAFDYFFAERVSVGFVPSVGTTSSHSADPRGTPFDRSGTSLGVGARVGYDVPLGPRVSLWPRAGLAYAATSNESSLPDPSSPGGTLTASWNEHALVGSISAPLLVHPAPHAFAGLGPYLTHDLSRSASPAGYTAPEATTIGVGLYVGGWW